METIIISVGGSLIVPDEIDTDFLNDFKKVIEQQVEKDKRFVIFAGGGKTARNYQEAGRDLTTLTDHDLDWLGIHATRINAHLLRSMFRDIAHERIVHNPTEKWSFDEDILIGAGWKPGWSTDYDAVMLAKQVGAKKVVNLTNIDKVYDKDPKKFEDAQPIDDISWKEYRELLPEEWDPGLNTPFDPIAAKEAEKINLEVAILNGKDLENFWNYLEGESFEGTTIK